ARSASALVHTSLLVMLAPLVDRHRRRVQLERIIDDVPAFQRLKHGLPNVGIIPQQFLFRAAAGADKTLAHQWRQALDLGMMSALATLNPYWPPLLLPTHRAFSSPSAFGAGSRMFLRSSASPFTSGECTSVLLLSILSTCCALSIRSAERPLS